MSTVHRTAFPFLLLLALLIFVAPAGFAAAPCSTDRAHEFDFWIGEWDVTSGGQLAGSNSIQPILGGCVIQETWTGAGGGAGSSFNFYNPQTQKWQQYWVWQNGTVLDMAGDYGDGKMILSGQSKNPKGETVTNRVTWYDNEDGSVRQHWEVSGDQGKSWTTAFDGHYKKKG